MILVQKRDPTCFIVFLVPNRVQVSINCGKWMEESLDFTLTGATGVQTRASKHPHRKAHFRMHHQSDSANILYFGHKIRTGVGELIW